MDSPSGKMTGKLVGGLCRLSTISEQEPDKLDTDSISYYPLGGSELGGSSISMCSDKFKNSSSRFSSDDSCQPGTGGTVDVIKLNSPETVELIINKIIHFWSEVHWMTLH